MKIYIFLINIILLFIMHLKLFNYRLETQMEVGMQMKEAYHDLQAIVVLQVAKMQIMLWRQMRIIIMGN